MANELDRRDIIKIAAASAVAANLLKAGTTGPGKFLSADELSLTADLADIIIPTDEKSPGAKAAGVAEFIDGRLAEAYTDDQKQERDDFRAGLKLFAGKSRDEQTALLTTASAREKEVHAHRHGRAAGEAPELSPEEKFYHLLKEHTIRGYYTSSIGIHQNQEYKGNVLQTGDYAGYLPHPL